MLLSDWRVLLRRWYISVAGLLVTVGLCLTAMNLVPATYQLTAQVSLLPSLAILQGEDQPQNPYLALGGLDGIADLVSRSMSDSKTAEAVKQAGGEGEYKVELDTSSPAPLLLMTVESPTPAQANKLTDLLLDRVPVNLHDLQASSNTPEKAMVKSKLLTRDEEITTVRKAQTRALVVAGGGGVVLTYLIAALVDGVLTRRRREDGAEGDLYEAAEVPARQPQPQGRPAKAATARPSRPVAEKPAPAKPAPVKPAAAKPAAAKKRPKAAPVEPIGAPTAAARPAEAASDGLEATLAGLLEPGDLEVPAGDARFTDDKTGPMPVIRTSSPDAPASPVNGSPANGHGSNGSAVNGKPANGSAVSAPAAPEEPEADDETEDAHLVSQRSRLDEDADLPLRGGGEAGLGRSRTLTSIRPRHNRPVPPPQ